MTTDRDVWLAVANVAGDVLGCSVRPEDTVFDHGVDSMMAVTLVAHLSDALGWEVEVIDLFESATLGEFVSQIVRRRIGVLNEK